jgi:catechol 2,3-dioxygenase-like lactoylglutathione lyase family enzyme
MEFRVEHIGLAAKDPVSLKDWYVRALGAELVFADGKTPPAFFLRLPGGVLLEIYASQSASTLTADNTVAGWRHLALHVASLETARQQLESRGVAFMDPVKPAGGGGRVLFFRDGEGNLLHLIERPTGSVFGQ